ncbi:MAG: hypothetical protein Q4B50_03355, partial [Bacillota bacterium]|nr:hypothetical protein [Bacillota bacterium]
MPFIAPESGKTVPFVDERSIAEAWQWYNQLKENLLPHNSEIARDLDTKEGRMALMTYDYDKKAHMDKPTPVFNENYVALLDQDVVALHTMAKSGQLFIYGLGEEQPYQLQESGEAHQFNPATDLVKPRGFIRWIKGVLNTISGGKWFAEDMAQYARLDYFIDNEKASFIETMREMKNPNVEAETPQKNAYDAARRLSVLDNFQFNRDPKKFQKTANKILKEQAAKKLKQ